MQGSRIPSDPKYLYFYLIFVIIIIINIIYSLELFTSASADGFSLESEW